MKRRWFVLAGLVLLILITSGLLLQARLRNPAAISIPGTLDDLPLTAHAFGREAAAHIAHLHGKDFLLTDAAVGEYGNGQATVWVSTTWGRWGAQRQIRAMTDAIAEGTSPFEPSGAQDVEGCTVYALTGMGQAHFYFRTGDQIVWLAVASDQAESALRELLDYYAPVSGSPGC